MREEIYEIIKMVKPDFTVDMAGLVTNKIIDSIEMMEIISRLEDQYDIEISMEYMDAKHFDNLESIVQTVGDLQD